MPTATADLSVVLVLAERFETLRRTLAHLRAQTLRPRIELVLVAPSLRAAEDVEPTDLEGFAGVRWVEVGPITNVDRASAPGMLAASAPVVAVIEDHAFPDPDWAEAVLAAHEQPWAAVGPAYVNANPASMFSWSNLLSNYGPWCRTEPPGSVIDDLPAHNIAYKRAVLEPFGDALPDMLGRDGSLHRRLRAAGHELYFEPRARVAHVNPSALGSSVLIRFRGGWTFGAHRGKDWPLWRRLAYVGGTPLIPLVHLPRIVGDARRAGRTRELIGALPTLCLGLGVAALGEACGYLLGPRDVDDKLAGMEFDRDRQLTRRDREHLAHAE